MANHFTLRVPARSSPESQRPDHYSLVWLPSDLPSCLSASEAHHCCQVGPEHTAVIHMTRNLFYRPPASTDERVEHVYRLTTQTCWQPEGRGLSVVGGVYVNGHTAHSHRILLKSIEPREIGREGGRVGLTATADAELSNLDDCTHSGH